jgi:two-component system chemotaxis response regulator CheY
MADGGHAIDVDQIVQAERPFVRGRAGRRLGWLTACWQIRWSLGPVVHALLKPRSLISARRATGTIRARGGTAFSRSSAAVSGRLNALTGNVLSARGSGQFTSLGGEIMRFLIVDDSSTMRRIIINTLNKLGHQDFVEAANGREGIDRLGSGAIDMIITDWNMPEMNGIDFIKAVRGTVQSKDVPVLMVTTNAAKDDIVEALRAGVNNYVVKPFTAETIKEKIDAVLAAK